MKSLRACGCVGLEFGFVHAVVDGLKAINILRDTLEDGGKRDLPAVIQAGSFTVLVVIQRTRGIDDQKGVVAGDMAVICRAEALLFSDFVSRCTNKRLNLRVL